jgi:hypothetical protein
MASEDFRLKHLLKVDSYEINFRTVYDDKLASHYYKRIDFRSPAEVVNSNSNDSDIIITMLTPVDYYLKKLDYVFIGWYEDAFRGISACGGRSELWSNAKLLYRDEQLSNLLNNRKKTVWLIAKSENTKKWFEIESIINEKFLPYKFSQSLDGDVNVYKIPTHFDRK